MSLKDIHNGLDAHLAAITDILPIIEENMVGSLVSDEDQSSRRPRYLRTTLLPIETETLSIGNAGHDLFEGLFQIDIFLPYGDGKDGANFWVDAIISQFNKGTHIKVNDTIIRVSNYWRETSLQQTNNYMTPVVIRWESCIQRQTTYGINDYT